MYKTFTFLIKFFLISTCFHAYAIEYKLPKEGHRLVGETTYHTVTKGESFQQIAQHYNIGFLALMAANPGIDPLLPDAGSQIIIPTQLILPYGDHDGIVINLSELRLYFFNRKQQTVNVFPVGIGKIGESTPILKSKITEKRKNPNWFPTQNKRDEYFKKHGKKMPRMIKAGPNNPLGDYAMRIGESVFLIHGTNQRFGIGMRASGGCIRMNPEDIEWLYKHTPSGTQVKIMDQPIKMTYTQDQKKVIEIHSPLTKDNGIKQTLWPLPESVVNFVGNNPEELKQLENMVTNPNGLPKAIEANLY